MMFAALIHGVAHLLPETGRSEIPPGLFETIKASLLELARAKKQFDKG